MKRAIAISDSANFYVSAERFFYPTLRGLPVIVLSNNDGCAIARSDEAKALDIEMGDPLHLIRDKVEAHAIMVQTRHRLARVAIDAQPWEDQRVSPAFRLRQEVIRLPGRAVTLGAFLLDGHAEIHRTLLPRPGIQTGVRAPAPAPHHQLKQHSKSNMTIDLKFLGDFGFGVEALEEVVRFDPIWEVWEQFGSFQNIKRSARPGEYEVFEISYSDRNHALSFLLPFDESGALSGPGRIALESRKEEIESR